MPSNALALAVVVAVLLVFTVCADSTAQSLVMCQPTQVEPNQNIGCTIYVRDSMQEPTTMFEVSDFYVAPIASVIGTPLAVSTVTIGADPTTLVFTVSAAAGTNVAINVYLRSTGEVIRGSGLTASVLVWPATRLGPITCSQANFINGGFPLRATTTCSAAVSGNTGLPAVVRPSDVLFSEDHFAGTFQFISGTRNLVFNYTAPATLSTPFTTFSLRVTLSSSDALYSVAFPVLYPPLSPTRVSLLQCNGVTQTYCFITAQDSLGPVAFDLSSFSIQFEKLDSINSAWQTSTSSMNVTAVPAPLGSVEQLSWTLLLNNEISTQRIRVFLSTQLGGAEIVGSPFVFTAGTAPVPAYVSLRGCLQQYVASQNTTTCIIDLLNGVTGDIRYFQITSSAGGVISNAAYGADASLGTPVITFLYTAPLVAMRTEDQLSVVVSGGAALNTPLRVIVYASTTIIDQGDNGRTNPGVVAVGLTFYGASLAIGLHLFCRRQSRIRKVQQARALHENEERHKVMTEGAAHHTYTTAHSTGKTRSSSQDSTRHQEEKPPLAPKISAAGTAQPPAAAQTNSPSLGPADITIGKRAADDTDSD